MPVRRMINNITPAAARGAPLKAAQLRDQPLVVEQIDAPRIDQREHVDVEIGLRLSTLLKRNAKMLELLRRKAASELIPKDLADPIALEHASKLLNCRLR